MDNTLVSVLMCFYNEKEGFLRESIESILNQTYRNIEFIIIGDSPPNNILPIVVREYAEKDSRIIYYQNESNIGLTKSLNKGLNLCKGEYVVRMDADDISLPDRIQKQVRYMDKHPRLVASGGGAYAIDENGAIIRRINVSSCFKDIVKTSIITSPILHPSAIIRLSDTIRYDETFRYAQDYALWISLMERDMLCVSNMGSPVIKYRYSSGQIFTKHKDEQMACANRLIKRINALHNIIVPSEDESNWNDLIRGLGLQMDRREVYEKIISSFNRKNTHVKVFVRKHISNILLKNLLALEKKGGLVQSVSTNYLKKSYKEKCFNFRFLLSCILEDARSFRITRNDGS